MIPKHTNVFSQLQTFEKEIGLLEGRILELETRIHKLLEIERNHLIRIKNGEEVSDDFIQNGRTYLDLSPEKAWRMYRNPDFDFILVDVTAKDFEVKRLPEALHIPWEEFAEKFLDIQSRTTPLLIISEDGTNSVLACEFLVKRGFYNCNNISGGYKFWKGFRLEEVKGQSA
ncbi:MAG: rhodanese-like domain-containing protein [Bdellovibrionales bacterium]|nr:rhodanese-like domain-containing protein [Bdellovibrionales bacterium]